MTLDATGAPQTVTLRWQATAAIQHDYTVFVQVLDADGGVVAQVDRPPQDGSFPTSTWRRGDVIDDVVTLPSPGGEWQQVIVGLYDASGTVLPVVEPVAGGLCDVAHAVESARPLQLRLRRLGNRLYDLVAST